MHRRFRELLTTDPGEYRPASSTGAQIQPAESALPALPALPDVVEAELVDAAPLTGDLPVLPPRPAQPTPHPGTVAVPDTGGVHIHAQTVYVVQGGRVDASTTYSHRGRGGHLVAGSHVSPTAFDDSRRRSLIVAAVAFLFRTRTRALATLAVALIAFCLLVG